MGNISCYQKILILGIAMKEFYNIVKVEAMIRGQLISKCPFGVFKSTKKTANHY